MKVAILNTLSRYGGAEVAVRNLFYGLRKKGIEARVFYRENKKISKLYTKIPQTKLDKFLINKIKPSFLSNFFKYNLVPSSLTKLSKLLDEFKPDIVHLHQIDAGCAQSSISYSVLKKFSKKYPLVWTWHNIHPLCEVSWPFCDDEFSQRYKKNCFMCPWKKNFSSKIQGWISTIYKKHIYKLSNFSIVTPSKWLKQKIKQATNLSKFPCYHVPNGINPKIFQKIPKAKEKLNIPQNKKVIFFLTADLTIKRKGLPFLLEALKKISLKNVYLIACGKKSEDLKTNLPFHFAGFIKREKLPIYYSAADIFVCPSLTENLPFTILEAMSCETACIGTKVGGIPEEIEDKKTGLIIPPQNSEKLSQAISFLLENDSLREKMAKAARLKIEKEFNMDLYIKRHLALYEKLVNQ